MSGTEKRRKPSLIRKSVYISQGSRDMSHNLTDRRVRWDLRVGARTRDETSQFGIDFLVNNLTEKTMLPSVFEVHLDREDYTQFGSVEEALECRKGLAEQQILIQNWFRTVKELVTARHLEFEELQRLDEVRGYMRGQLTILEIPFRQIKEYLRKKHAEEEANPVAVYFSHTENAYSFPEKTFFPKDLIVSWKRTDFTHFDSIEDARNCHDLLTNLREAIENWKRETKKAIGTSSIKDARRMPGLQEKREEMQRVCLEVEKAQGKTNDWLMENDEEYRRHVQILNSAPRSILNTRRHL